MEDSKILQKDTENFQLPGIGCIVFTGFISKNSANWIVGGRYKICVGKRGYLFTAHMNMVYKLLLQANA